MPNLRPLHSNFLSLRLLPSALALGLVLLTVGCQSDDPTLDDPIELETGDAPSSQIAPPADEDAEDEDEDKNAIDLDTTDAGELDTDEPESDDTDETESDEEDEELDEEADDILSEDADEDDEDSDPGDELDADERLRDEDDERLEEDEDVEEEEIEEEEEDEFADGDYGEVDGDNTYQPRDREFQVTLPEGYDIQPQRDGVAFISSDGGFGGEVVFFDETESLDADDLEERLKDLYDELLDGASWQLSEIQPDGSLRLDWVGTTPEGNALDAVSYIEQRDDVVFILNVYGIDRPYDAFLGDSQSIIGSYLTWPEDDDGFEEEFEDDEFE